MPAQKPADDKEQAKLEAEAEKLAEKADDAQEKADDLAAAAQKAEEAAEDQGLPRAESRRCPNCRAHLIPHGDDNPHKAGAWHCNGCGTCWAPGLRHPR